MLHKKKSAGKSKFPADKKAIRIYGPNGNIYGYDPTALLRNSLQKRIERKEREKNY